MYGVKKIILSEVTQNLKDKHGVCSLVMWMLAVKTLTRKL